MREVRPLEPGDEAGVAGLFAAYLAEFGALIDTDVAGEARALFATYAAPDARLLVATVDGAVAGCVGWKRVGSACEMKRLVVAPSQRGQGLGRVLVEAILADAAEAGFGRMFLVTTEAMAAARALYAKLGFRPASAYRPTVVTCALTMDVALAKA
ncbi:MAG: GNAT family N-acetyltransferase [Thermoplasmatota archaeon]|nr:GNAT family N-acetyltransferase [Halobacteriales archaeon]